MKAIAYIDGGGGCKGGGVGSVSLAALYDRSSDHDNDRDRLAGFLQNWNSSRVLWIFHIPWRSTRLEVPPPKH